MWIIISFVVITSTLTTLMGSTQSFASRNALTPDQKKLLRTVQNIRVQTLALTEKGVTNSDAIQHIVSERLTKVGLTVVHTAKKPHSIIVKVKCEERRSAVAMTKIGGDADQPGTPSHIWRGPACQLTYSLDGQKRPWRQEVRTTFEDAWQAAKVAGSKSPGLYALDQLKEVLQENDFPLELLAEWGQTERLANMLTSNSTSTETKQKILRLAKKIPGQVMLQALHTTLSDNRLAPHAIFAMGYMGKAATPTLLELLEKSDSVEIKASAARGLGEIGAHSGDTSILPTLLAMMDAPQIDLQVQTEIVKAVGKIPDYQSIDPLKKLGLKSWTSKSRNPHMQELREAIDWSLWQIDPTDSSH